MSDSNSKNSTDNRKDPCRYYETLILVPAGERDWFIQRAYYMV
jgi:hypothetical protein